jgi:hypothetical protein
MLYSINEFDFKRIPGLFKIDSMILLRLRGGLGNQMFQYAFGCFLSEHFNVQLKLDTSLLGLASQEEHTPTRDFDLAVFKIEYEFADEKDVAGFFGKNNPSYLDGFLLKWNKLFDHRSIFMQDYHKFSLDDVMELKPPIALVGRWQSERYFESIKAKVRSIYCLDHIEVTQISKEVETLMNTCISVSIHIRRGDYVSHPVFSKKLGALNLSYYKTAIELIVSEVGHSNIKLFFISEDMDWCRSNFNSYPNAVFIEQEKSRKGFLSDMRLISKSDHVIISNSTFSWWGAYIGQKEEGIVVAPKKWAKTYDYTPPHIIPDSWIQVENEFEP